MKVDEITPQDWIEEDDVRMLGEEIEKMKLQGTAFSFKGIKWALTDQKRTEGILQRLREYNGQLEGLSQPLFTYKGRCAWCLLWVLVMLIELCLGVEAPMETVKTLKATEELLSSKYNSRTRRVPSRYQFISTEYGA